MLQYNELKGIDWSWLSMDGAMTKAPCPGQKMSQNLADRGKQGVKRSLSTEARDILAVAIEEANRHGMKLVREILEVDSGSAPSASGLTMKFPGSLRLPLLD